MELFEEGFEVSNELFVTRIEVMVNFEEIFYDRRRNLDGAVDAGDQVRRTGIDLVGTANDVSSTKLTGGVNREMNNARGVVMAEVSPLEQMVCCDDQRRRD
jgi:hypothetical protein